TSSGLGAFTVTGLRVGDHRMRVQVAPDGTVRVEVDEASGLTVSVR
ncbi:MAG: hypothetical protein JWO76_2408, partial [Nocardioides sp.]|nr:hypothetical protein [Nocardioides sp.]